MQDINIEEQKKSHTKAIAGIVLVILFVVFVALYYVRFATTAPSTATPLSSALEKTLAHSVNTAQSTDTAIPDAIRSFLGKWRGEWTLADGTKLPVAFVVSDISQKNGLSVYFGSDGDMAHNITPVEGSISGTVVLLPKKEPTFALEVAVPQFQNNEPAIFHFWFTGTDTATLTGSYTDPVTKKDVQGTFGEVKTP